MREQFAMPIVPDEPWLKVNSGKAWPLYREVRNFFVRHSKLQRDGFELRATATQFDESRDFFRLDQLDCRESLQCVVDVINLLRYQLELVSGQVFGQYATLAVENQAPYWRHSLDTHAIALGLFGKQLVVEHLQLDKSGDDKTQKDR